MTEIFDIRTADDPRDMIHRACQHLAEGRLVGLPTETTYVAVGSVLHPQAVTQLRDLSGESARLTLYVKDDQECRDYIASPPRMAEKLLRRCWPGPVALRLATTPGQGLLSALDSHVSESLIQDGELQVRVPAHQVFHEILRLMPGALAGSLDPDPEGNALADIEMLQSRFPDALSAVIQDGPTRYGEPTTVVRTGTGGLEIVSDGVVTLRTLGRLGSDVYLFVCTGNTCRSPMAEAIFRKLLAESLGCAEEELADRGFVVLSAGLAAAMGAPASPEGVQLLADDGIDLRAHESQPLTNRLLNQVDYVFTMTKHHRDAILGERPDLRGRVEVLSRTGHDISDPIGGTVDDYRACKEQIEGDLRELIEQLPRHDIPR